MSETYTVSLESVIDELQLEKIYYPEKPSPILLDRKEVNRPGLQLAGFFDHFDPLRIQIVGKVEYHYLLGLTPPQRKVAIDTFMSKHIAALIITSGLDVFDEFRLAAEKFETPVLRTHDTTSNFMGSLIASLNVSLADRMTRHGVLVECYGEGILMLGDSGIGKSETAIELVKRGHRLIADDAVEIKRVSNKSLVGSAPEIIRHFIELRGIGIVDVKRIFGMGSVKDTENIDLVINLENWQNGKAYDRLGIETEHTDILGIKVPSLTIPIKPGRNLASIVEVAAMNNRNRKMGHNAALELTRRMDQHFARKMGVGDE